MAMPISSRWLTLFALFFAAVFAFGCAKKSATDNTATPASQASASAPAGEQSPAPESSATGPAGCASAASDIASPASTTGSDQTGLPLYPSATRNTSISGPENGAATVAVTNDSFDKVYAWYESRIPQSWTRGKTDTSEGSVATYQLEEGATTKSIMIAGNKDKTTITLATSK